MRIAATSPAPVSPVRAVVGGLACVGLTAVIIGLGAVRIGNRETAGGSDFALEVPDASLVANDGDKEDIPMLLPPDASGTADGTSPAPEAEADAAAEKALIAPPAPDKSVAPVPSFNAHTSAPAPAPITLTRPIVLAAGRFNIGGKELQLDGILPVDVSRQCTDSSGEGWPCGRMARTAFANLVRGRTIDCDVPAAQWSGTAIAHCTLAGKDLSQWLAENGWAEVAPGAPLQTHAAAARAAGRGLYSPDPRRRKAAASGNTGTSGGETRQQPEDQNQ
ncbi:thermonuclease family protein [Mycoplana dimorpha]|uniref:Endonuclease YncB(Thermonuclease family) n=1 Tax=Mycoplana dimorpha TaxID=28320 RepID=A0A2T5BF59_MYCDI|nr:hypothetical protein [Mycoplana dimorpha]PTM97610.1 hypothetical protein C7449_102487 [Mycoplana dimorpha]